MNATVVPYDYGFRDATKSKDDPTATTVTIAPGGRVDFNYPTGDGKYATTASSMFWAFAFALS